MASEPRTVRSRLVRILLGIISVGIGAFWIWALFFPQSKESVAKLDDIEWTRRADEICRAANLQRDELADLRRIDEVGSDALSIRADLIDQATTIIDDMLTTLVRTRPTGQDDGALLDTWVSYYRQWIEDRRTYAEVVRGGENPPFGESMVEGSPISDYINDFTIANRMTACSAPTDLAA